MRFRAALALALPAVVAVAQVSAPPQALAGEWKATLEAGGARLRIVLHLAPAADGGWTGTLDSLDQRAMGLKLGEITRKGLTVSFTLPQAGARFEGSLDEAGTVLTGHWIQGARLPLVFTRGAATQVAPRRPQEPQAPFPYDVEAVSFPGGAKEVTLSATLTLPKGKGPFPAVILVAGSGPNDRDEQVFGHRPFLVLADHLTRHGLAVLRYDKRGIGQSTGSFAAATTFDFADDAEKALAYLKARPEVNGKTLGLLGHSEGGLVGPIVATRTAVATFLVLLAGPAVTGEDILFAQLELLAKAQGASASVLVQQRKRQEQIYACLKQHPEGAQNQLRTLLTADLSPELRKASEAAVTAQIRQVDNPWFRTFLTLDPRPYLKQVKIPVLALFGEKDLQVPPAQNRPEMEKALQSAGNPRAEVHVLAGLNHLFQPASTGAPTEYASSETTLAPAALEAISAWILAL
jgi:pimeloyl-ACP methyl ester carboxylesterase